MRLSRFDFELPEELIALHPAKPRESARLLHVGSAFSDYTVADLPGLLRRGDLLIFNNTRVIPARLYGKVGGAAVEVTLHKSLGAGRWSAFGKPGRKLKPGATFSVTDGFVADVITKDESGEVTLEFTCADAAFYEKLARHGVVPLPPYIASRRAAGAHDSVDYQTVFAEKKGAVAAPTAGLHFTENMLRKLEEKGVGHACVTLHVGAGTFLPVKTQDVRQHKMHSEWYSVPPDTAEQFNHARAAGGRIVAVGTTSLRTLESACDENGQLHPRQGETDIFITPGYRFRGVDALFTNFHTPRSTLFMLVCAFAGEERMKEAYRHAIERRYRFYSYGDACLLEKAELSA